MTRLLNKEKGHTVFLDNLFISLKLLSTLRKYSIKATGTVRTSKTKREENKEKRVNEELKSYKTVKLYELP